MARSRLGLPRSGDELLERIAARWRWYFYRIRSHPLSTDELPRIGAGLYEYVRLMRLDRPIGIWLLLWPTLWALWIASRGKPAAGIFLIFLFGTVLMRSQRLAHRSVGAVHHFGAHCTAAGAAAQ